MSSGEGAYEEKEKDNSANVATTKMLVHLKLV